MGVDLIKPFCSFGESSVKNHFMILTYA